MNLHARGSLRWVAMLYLVQAEHFTRGRVELVMVDFEVSKGRVEGQLYVGGPGRILQQARHEWERCKQLYGRVRLFTQAFTQAAAAMLSAMVVSSISANTCVWKAYEYQQSATAQQTVLLGWYCLVVSCASSMCSWRGVKRRSHSTRFTRDTRRDCYIYIATYTEELFLCVVAAYFHPYFQPLPRGAN